MEEGKLLTKEMTLKRLFYKQIIGGPNAGIYCQYPLKIVNEKKFLEILVMP